MRINWVFSAQFNPGPEIDLKSISNVGPTWGSYRSWRSCNTDNVVCHDKQKAKELLNRAFQAVCNFYLPKKFYQDLERPKGVKLYEGDYHEMVDDLEDIISMHLAASNSDIVLLAGFDLSTPGPVNDRLTQHRIQNRLGLVHKVIKDHAAVQWVLVDHPMPMAKAYTQLTNITCDTLNNVLQLLK